MISLNIFVIGSVLISFFLILSPTWAAIVYNGGGPNPGTGGGSSDLQSDIISADLIRLKSSPVSVTALEWWGFYISEEMAQDDFFFAIYPIEGGLPAEPAVNILHLGNVSRQPDLIFGGYYYSAELVMPLNLPKNTDLAVAIYNNTGPGYDDNWAWYTSGVGDGFAMPVGNISSSWEQDRDYAFILYGAVIPEPSTIGLLAPGLAGLGFRRGK